MFFFIIFRKSCIFAVEVGISNIGFLGANITTNVPLHDGTMYNGERDTWYTGFRLMFHVSFY